MKPITEIRYKICVISIVIVFYTFRDLYPPGSGLEGLAYTVMAFITGAILGFSITDFLIAFKKWWKE